MLMIIFYGALGVLILCGWMLSLLPNSKILEAERLEREAWLKEAKRRYQDTYEGVAERHPDSKILREIYPEVYARADAKKKKVEKV